MTPFKQYAETRPDEWRFEPLNTRAITTIWNCLVRLCKERLSNFVKAAYRTLYETMLIVTNPKKIIH